MKHRHLWCIQLTCSVVNCVNLNYFLRTHSYLSFKVPVRVCACIFFVVFFFLIWEHDNTARVLYNSYLLWLLYCFVVEHFGKGMKTE